MSEKIIYFNNSRERGNVITVCTVKEPSITDGQTLLRYGLTLYRKHDPVAFNHKVGVTRARQRLLERSPHYSGSFEFSTCANHLSIRCQLLQHLLDTTRLPKWAKTVIRRQLSHHNRCLSSVTMYRCTSTKVVGNNNCLLTGTLVIASQQGNFVVTTIADSTLVQQRLGPINDYLDVLIPIQTFPSLEVLCKA